MAFFGNPLPPQVLFSQLAASQSYTSDTTGSTILSLDLQAGSYQIEVFVRFNTNGANSKIVSVTTDANAKFSGYRATFNNGGSPARICGVDAGTTGGGPWGNTTNTEQHERYGIIKSNVAHTYTITASQNSSSVTTTIVGAGSYILARKLP